jgi:hypothetical protein
MMDDLPVTRVYKGVVPSLEQLCVQAGVTRDSIEPNVRQLADHCTWAFMGRECIEMSLQDVASDAHAGDMTVLAGPAPHAGPAASGPRILGFCAVGGLQEHEPEEEFNPWNLALTLRSERMIVQTCSEYWDHSPHL